MKDKKKLKTSFGSPVDDDQNSITVGPTGPVLLQDVHLIEKLAHFNRECIPERKRKEATL
jgi:catalase